MIKIESNTLKGAFQDAASSLECSVTELKIEVVQYPSAGFLGLFKKTAIIVAMRERKEKLQTATQKEEKKPEVTINKAVEIPKKEEKKEEKKEKKKEKREKKRVEQKHQTNRPKHQKEKQEIKKESTHIILNDTIMPQSFVSTQDEEHEYNDVSSYLADYEEDEEGMTHENISEIASQVKKDINKLFHLTCFEIDKIEVEVYDENTLLIEFKGKDVALLIGKEGYRYKALSYMIFNWINTKYQVQLRLEIAEFLKNQEEAVSRYLANVYENIEKDGKAQTKILDGVLVQIALKELRERYPEKYVVIRSTRDGLKYIIVNDYHTN